MQQEESTRLDHLAFPIELISCPFFTYKEKEVILDILSDSSTGVCQRSNKELARRHRVTPQTITNLITMANRLGFITDREDTRFSKRESDGSTSCVAERKLKMKIPAEWSYMAGLYNDAFLITFEDNDAFNRLENIEVQLLSIPKSQITRERVKKILLTIGGN